MYSTEALHPLVWLLCGTPEDILRESGYLNRPGLGVFEGSSLVVQQKVSAIHTHFF